MVEVTVDRVAGVAKVEESKEKGIGRVLEEEREVGAVEAGGADLENLDNIAFMSRSTASSISMSFEILLLFTS